MKTYKKLTELNPPKHPSCGTITCYYGESPWVDNKPYGFIEVADCMGKIRLHMAKRDKKKDLIYKAKKLRDALNDYIDYLEKI